MSKEYTRHRYYYSILKDDKVVIESSFVLENKTADEASIAVSSMIGDIGKEYFDKYGKDSYVQVIVTKQVVELPIKAFKVSDGLYEAILQVKSTNIVQTIAKNIKDNLYIDSVICDV